MVEVFYLLVPGVVLAHQRNPPHAERRRPLHCPQPKISNRSKDYLKFSAQFWWKAYYCVKSKHLQNMLLRGQSSSQYKVTKCSLSTGLQKLWYPSIRDTSTWSKFEAHGGHGDVFLFSNLGAL